MLVQPLNPSFDVLPTGHPARLHNMADQKMMERLRACYEGTGTSVLSGPCSRPPSASWVISSVS